MCSRWTQKHLHKYENLADCILVWPEFMVRYIALRYVMCCVFGIRAAPWDPVCWISAGLLTSEEGSSHLHPQLSICCLCTRPASRWPGDAILSAPFAAVFFFCSPVRKPEGDGQTKRDQNLRYCAMDLPSLALSLPLIFLLNNLLRTKKEKSIDFFRWRWRTAPRKMVSMAVDTCCGLFSFNKTEPGCHFQSKSH